MKNDVRREQGVLWASNAWGSLKQARVAISSGEGQQGHGLNLPTLLEIQAVLQKPSLTIDQS
jgi:hypothetical protein